MSKKVYCKNKKSFVPNKNLGNYDITGKIKFKGVSCAVAKSESGNTYYIPFEHISFIRKPGESNISAKLTNIKVKNIVKKHFQEPETKIVDTAKKYGVATTTISSILHSKSWTHITKSYLQQLSNGVSEETCLVVSNSDRKPNTKLSGSLAKFIVRDHLLNKISSKKLAAKFLVSKSQINRILSGKAWSEFTKPAIEEFSSWSK